MTLSGARYFPFLSTHPECTDFRLQTCSILMVIRSLPQLQTSHKSYTTTHGHKISLSVSAFKLQEAFSEAVGKPLLPFGQNCISCLLLSQLLQHGIHYGWPDLIQTQSPCSQPQVKAGGHPTSEQNQSSVSKKEGTAGWGITTVCCNYSCSLA